MRRSPAAFLSIPLLLAACGQEMTPPASSATARTTSTSVPVATAQALSLQLQLQSQLKNKGNIAALDLSTVGAATAEVEDLNGSPLYHLTLIGSNVTDFWQTLKNPGTEQYEIYGTGALTTRDFFSFILNETWISQVQRTLDAAGSFSAFTSPGGGTLYLKDKQGRTWDIISATQVSDQTLQDLRQTFQKVLAQRQQDGTLSGLQQAWERYDAEANGIKSQAVSGAAFPSLKSLTLANGNLDVQKLVGAIQQHSNSVLTTQATSSRYPNEKSWCEGWFCAGMGYAAAVRSPATFNSYYNENNPESYGNFRGTDITNWDQNLSVFGSGLPAGGVWSQPDLLGTGNIRTPQIGCAPMAALRLMNWYAASRQTYTGRVNLRLAGPTAGVNPNFAGTAIEDVEAKAFMSTASTPIRIGQTTDGYAGYQPLIGQYMHTNFFVNGTFTRDTDMVPGINSFIQNKGQDKLSLQGTSFAFVNLGGLAVYSNPIGAIGFSQFTWNVRNIVRDKIGRDNEPVVIMYPYSNPNDATGHYTMSQAYIVHEGWFSANVLMWVTIGGGDGRQGQYVNITDATGNYGGAWAFMD